MKKRIAILLLAVLLAVTSSPVATATPTAEPVDARGPLFTDLPADHWAHEYVAPLYEQGVVNGYPDGSFRPTKTVTWGEAFKLILLAIGEDEPEPQPGEHWAYPYIEPAISNRLMYVFEILRKGLSSPYYVFRELLVHHVRCRWRSPGVRQARIRVCLSDRRYR